LILTRQQIQRIILLLHAYRENDDDPESYEEIELEHFMMLYPRILAEVESPEELHYYAINYNWDDGLDLLRPVIDHPLCDQGTALFLFWLGQPDWFYDREADGRIGSGDSDNLRFLKDVQAKYLESGFPSHRIRVDPTDMVFGVDYTEPGPDSTGVGIGLVPALMKQASPGEPLEFISF
jgi:hypothetical protein